MWSRPRHGPCPIGTIFCGPITRGCLTLPSFCFFSPIAYRCRPLSVLYWIIRYIDSGGPSIKTFFIHLEKGSEFQVPKYRNMHDSIAPVDSWLIRDATWAGVLKTLRGTHTFQKKSSSLLTLTYLSGWDALRVILYYPRNSECRAMRHGMHLEELS